MITVYGPNGEQKKINARTVVEWLSQNPGYSLDNPETEIIDESVESVKKINRAIAGDPSPAVKEASAITEEIATQYEQGIYYSGVPNLIANPNWDGVTVQEKFVPSQVAFPGLNLIPSYEGDLYLSGANFNSVNIANMQELLEDADYLKGFYNPGSNDAATKAAVRAWFNDVNGFRLDSWSKGVNNNIDPMEFLGNQINNRFNNELFQIKEATEEILQTVDRGKMLRDNLQKAIGNRRDFTSTELEAYRDVMNDLINQEIKRNEEIAIFKLKKEFGRLPDTEAISELGLQGQEGSAFMAAAEAQATQPEAFSASEAFLNKIEPLYKSFREYPERQDRARLNFNNINRSILGTSMRIA
jgi:hypothetical protein